MMANAFSDSANIVIYICAPKVWLDRDARSAH